MNDKRRKQLQKAIDFIKRACDIIDDARYGEQESMDNIPESLQVSEKYEHMEDVCDALDKACDYCDDVVEALKEAIK